MAGVSRPEWPQVRVLDLLWVLDLLRGPELARWPVESAPALVEQALEDHQGSGR